MSTPHLLLLGGTTESRLLANELADAFPGWHITNSLAGRTHTTPNLPGDTRIGGFGGPENMATWLRENEISAIIDATHPFANTITTNTITAARTAIPGHEIPYLRLQRPQWEPQPGDNWHSATSPTDAAQHIDTLGTHALITTGRRDLAAFTHVKAHCLIRTIEPPTQPLPTSHELILDRGPYTLEGETTLINNHHIDVLVTKNSGGAATAPKLQAARNAGIPVIMIQRPTLPDDIDIAESLPEALLWLARVNARPTTHQPPTPTTTTNTHSPTAHTIHQLQWPWTGALDDVTHALDNHQPVDLDNPTNWPLPPLGDTLATNHQHIAARLIVTDMDPLAAMQFGTDTPTLILTPPSLIIGIGGGSSINARDILKHLREIMSANLLASGAIATLVSVDRNGKYGLLTETALLLEHLEKNHRHEIGVKVYDPHTLAQHNTPNPNPHVADLTGTPSVAEAAVLAAGARLIIGKHIANHGHGSSTIAIGRITP